MSLKSIPCGYDKTIIAYSAPFLYLCNVKVYLTFAGSLSFFYIHLPMHLF